MNRPVFDTARALRARECRDQTGLYSVEGARFLVAAADAGARIEGLVVCPALLRSVAARMIVRRLRRAGVPEDRVDEGEYATIGRLSDGRGRGVIAVVRQRWSRLERLERDDLWMTVDEVRSPGNLGTLLRSSLACGARGIIVTGDADVFDPACVRATMGALEGLRVVRMSMPALVALVRDSRGSLVAASPRGSVDYRAASYRGPTVVHVGAERQGVTCEVERSCDSLVRIPMSGPLDSLNVAVAGSIVLYEAFRQRFPLPGPPKHASGTARSRRRPRHCKWAVNLPKGPP